jgi:hypothetical protein
MKILNKMMMKILSKMIQMVTMRMRMRMKMRMKMMIIIMKLNTVFGVSNGKTISFSCKLKMDQYLHLEDISQLRSHLIPQKNDLDRHQ